MSNILEVKELSKHYPVSTNLVGKVTKTLKAVDRVSFSVETGEIFGIVGESGCGKTTVGRSVIRLINPTNGFITFDNHVIYNHGHPIEDYSSKEKHLRRNMQMIFQDPYASLDPRMKIKDTIAEGVRKYKIVHEKDIDSLICDVLNQCGLDSNCLHKYPHEFSGGQRQRIGIARALSMNPKMIIADEPLAALDVSVQSQVIKIMLHLKEQFKLTYVLISHDLGVMKYVCDRIAVMYLGSIVEIGKSEELFSQPLHPYTKALFSAVPKAYPWTEKNRIVLSGDIPSPTDLSAGCKFKSRCAHATSKCLEEPGLDLHSSTHFVRCHYAK